MTAIYAETSAVLAHLFTEPDGPVVREVLSQAEVVVTSRLTLVEAGRAIVRGRASGRFTEVEALALRQLLDELVEQWAIIDLVGFVTDRAGERFPAEPVRSLDALHLASALVFDRDLGKVAVLSLDERIRANAAAMGLALA